MGEREDGNEGLESRGMPWERRRGSRAQGWGHFLCLISLFFFCVFFFRVCGDLFFDLSFYVYFFKDVFGILLYSKLIGKQGIARVEPRLGVKEPHRAEDT